MVQMFTQYRSIIENEKYIVLLYYSEKSKKRKKYLRELLNHQLGLCTQLLL